MPVFINEVVTQIPATTESATGTAPVENQTPVSQTEYELLQTLSLIEERRQRLQFD